MVLRASKPLGDVALGEVRRWANSCDDDGGRLYALPLVDSYEELRAEVERLRQDGEEGARQFLRLSGEVERLQTELARWKPKACGRIFPIPVPGEAVEYCVRAPDHDGAHQAKTGTTWRT